MQSRLGRVDFVLIGWNLLYYRISANQNKVYNLHLKTFCSQNLWILNKFDLIIDISSPCLPSFTIYITSGSSKISNSWFGSNVSDVQCDTGETKSIKTNNILQGEAGFNRFFLYVKSNIYLGDTTMNENLWQNLAIIWVTNQMFFF